MGVEAVVFFDPAHAWEFELRRKRGAHLFSKHRFLAAQMAAYLEDGLWLDLARDANAANARLVEGLKTLPAVEFPWRPQANITFTALPRAAHERLHRAGAAYHLWNARLEGGDPNEMLQARLVCDWSASEEHTARFLEVAQG
jgi:threonine aldolase